MEHRWSISNIEWNAEREQTTIHLYVPRDPRIRRTYTAYGKEFHDLWHTVPLSQFDTLIQELLIDERFKEIESAYAMDDPTELKSSPRYVLPF